jgi:hypothetical protein
MSPNSTNQASQININRPAALALAWFTAVVSMSSQMPAAQAEAALPVLKSASEIRQLTPEAANQALPVQIRGVVTFWDAQLYSWFVQDGTAGIYLKEMTNMPSLVPGQQVAVEGVTSPGEYAPVVVPRRLTVEGEGKFPVAKTVNVVDLVAGTEDSQFVEISGIVRSVRYEEESGCHLVDIVAGGERFTAYAKELPVGQPATLVDSTVRVRGVCSTMFNRLRQLFGFRLLVPRPSDLIVEQAAPANPFEAPAQTITSLLRFTPKGNYGRRVKVTGTVACQELGRALFIQDGAEGLFAQTRLRLPVQAGDRVEVLGFPAKGEYTPILQDAVYRKIGDGKAPTPAEVDLDEVLKGPHDCQLVTMKANLLERTQRGREQFLLLESGGFTFRAYFSQDADVTQLDRLLNGSEVSVTGVCLIERGSGWQAGESWRAKSSRLLVPAVDDVRVIKSPPWWSQPAKVRVAGIISVLVLAALVLIDVLRRRPKASIT